MELYMHFIRLDLLRGSYNICTNQTKCFVINPSSCSTIISKVHCKKYEIYQNPSQISLSDLSYPPDPGSHCNVTKDQNIPISTAALLGMVNHK